LKEDGKCSPIRGDENRSSILVDGKIIAKLFFNNYDILIFGIVCLRVKTGVCLLFLVITVVNLSVSKNAGLS
jgi:hypothetical protein